MRFLESLSVLSTVHGEGWRAGMRRYYGGRLEGLLFIAPVPCRHLIAGYRKRLGKV